MSDLGFSVSYKSIKCRSWKSTIKILFVSQFSTNKNKDTNQSVRRPRLFFGSSEKSRLECLNSGVSEFLSWIFLWRCFPRTSILFSILFTWLLNSWKIYSVCKSVVAKLRISRRTCISHFALWRSRIARLEYRIVTIPMVHLETQMPLLPMRRALNERPDRKTFFFWISFTFLLEVIE